MANDWDYPGEEYVVADVIKVLLKHDITDIERAIDTIITAFGFINMTGKMDMDLTKLKENNN